MLDADGIADVAPFGRQLREAIDWFLINGTDLVPHLEGANADGAFYGGRRVEHSWRALDRFVDNWEEANGGYDGDWGEDAARIAAETARLPPLPDPQTPAAAAWAGCAHGAFQVAGDAVHRLEPRRDVVPVQMRIAREAYSLYRLAEYRWIALALAPNELAASPIRCSNPEPNPARSAAGRQSGGSRSAGACQERSRVSPRSGGR